MILCKVLLKGYRNFQKAHINFRKKTLIIGANDVGKTNLLCAIRLLLDRGSTDYDLEPKDSDFFALEETNMFRISLYFEDVTEDCVLSKLKEKVSDDGKLVLIYEGFRDPKTKAKSYKLYAGPSFQKKEEIEDRYYRKVLNVKYISSRRDFHNYINREKNYLFEIAKANRTDAQIVADDKLYAKIQDSLKTVDAEIPKLNFIASATNTINEELGKLSLHHTKQEIVFDATTSNADNFINSVSISSKSNGQSLLIGGDGRLNQIYLALWSSRNELTEENLKEVTIFCIEEPEAHLHPHQQRKLADYLNTFLKGQVLLTSHSPQIASEFSPNSIVKLFNDGLKTEAASNGCSNIIGDAINDFGYRMSIIPAEAFFADVVLLVEGPSEQIFYKTLAHQLDIDLDRLNISILMVDGVGFKTFAEILNALSIEWVIRTDNDVFKVPKKDLYRFAGIQRCLALYRKFWNPHEDTDKIIGDNEINLTFSSEKPNKRNLAAAAAVAQELESYNLFLSVKDLENDLYNSTLKEKLQEHFDTEADDEVIASMQKNKAIFMYKFLKKFKSELKDLITDDIVKPLYACKKLVDDKHV